MKLIPVKGFINEREIDGRQVIEVVQIFVAVEDDEVVEVEEIEVKSNKKSN